MGGLFSSEPEVPKWDGSRTPYNLYSDRQEDWLRDETRRSTPTQSTPRSTYSTQSASSAYPMGGLFSYLDRQEELWLRDEIRRSTRTQSTPRSTYSTQSASNAYRTSNVNSFGYVQSHRTSTAVSPKLSCASNNNSSIRVRSSKTVISNADLIRFQEKLYSAILGQARVLKWHSVIQMNAEYKLVPLEIMSLEYNKVCTKFMRGVAHDARFSINVKKIERVENLYLMGQYYLKRLEYGNKSLPIEERQLFHGTKSIYIDNICKNNFDWRLHGTTKGNKFGKGVSFTPKSPYANHYCDRNVNNKVMIVAKVLVSKVCPGDEFMNVPPYYDRNRLLRYDTSIKEPKKDVVVKYTDDEFYPAYLIHYSGKMFYHNKGFSR